MIRLMIHHLNLILGLETATNSSFHIGSGQTAYKHCVKGLGISLLHEVIQHIYLICYSLGLVH